MSTPKKLNVTVSSKHSNPLGKKKRKKRKNQATKTLQSCFSKVVCVWKVSFFFLSFSTTTSTTLFSFIMLGFWGMSHHFNCPMLYYLLYTLTTRERGCGVLIFVSPMIVISSDRIDCSSRQDLPPGRRELVQAVYGMSQLRSNSCSMACPFTCIYG